MKQVYNLLQTIEDDKAQVAKLKRQLHNAESILEAHTAALTRLTTIPEISQTKVEKVDYSPAVEERERITPDNWKDLNIKVGDKVEVIVSGDDDFANDSEYKVTKVEDPDYKGRGFIDLNGTWYCYDNSEEGTDEIYLIRTEEGSLND